MLLLAACTSSPASSDSPAGTDTAADTGSADTGDTAVSEPPGIWIRIGEREYDTLEAAGRAVRNGQTIEVCGEHAGPLDIEASAESPISVSVQGCSPEWAVISGQGVTHGVFALYTSLSLDTLSVVNGLGFTLEDTVCCSPECDDLCDRRWSSAGGVSVVRAALDLRNVVLSDNRGAFTVDAVMVSAYWIEDSSGDPTVRSNTWSNVRLTPNRDSESERVTVALWGVGAYTLAAVDWGTGDASAGHTELAVDDSSSTHNAVGYDLTGVTNLYCETDPVGCVEL